MSTSKFDDSDPDAIETLTSSSTPEDWEATDVVFSSDLVVRLELPVDRDLFSLLTLAARQAGMPLLEWVKAATREQALRALASEQSSERRDVESGEQPR